jgi:hypothetical protein
MSCSVFVGNLTWSTTSEHLKDFANQVGRVVSAEVKRHEDTSRSKGWGYVVEATIFELVKPRLPACFFSFGLSDW